MRRRTTTHFPDFDKGFDLSTDAIFKNLKEDNSEDDSKFVRAAQRIFSKLSIGAIGAMSYVL